MRRIVLLLTLLAAPLALAALSTSSVGGPTYSPAGPAPAATSGSEPDGKKIFLAQKCNLCHSIEVAGIEATTKSEKLKGPDLAATPFIGSREDLAKFVRQTIQLDGKKHKKGFKGTDEELATLFDWLTAQQKKAAAKKGS